MSLAKISGFLARAMLDDLENMFNFATILHRVEYSLINNNIMSNFTSMFRKGFLLGVLGLCAAGVSAATLDYNGITYTIGTGANATKLTVAKASTAIGAYEGDIVIPDSPVTIEGTEYTIIGVASTAFKNNTAVTSLYLPDGCTTIARGSLSGMTALKSIRMPGDITTINGDMFSGDVSLEEFTFPASLTKLGSNMFVNCTSLRKLIFEESDAPFDWSVNTAFYITDQKNNSGEITIKASPLEELVINRTITGFDQSATVPFRGCSTLKKVSLGDKVTSVLPYYFENCTALTDLTLGSNIETIGVNAFANTGISSVILPEKCTQIQSSTFQNCKSLTSVQLGSAVTSIAEMAFYNAPVVTVNLPATLTSIGAYAFSGGKIEGKLEIPEGVTSIGAQAFAYNNISAVSLPSTLNNLGVAAFMLCKNVVSIDIPEENAAYKQESDALLTKDGNEIVFYALASAAAEYSNAIATKIQAHAFHGASNLANINVPAVAEYGDYALAGTGVTKQAVSGTIGRYVLAECPSLAEVSVLTGREMPFGIVANCPEVTNFSMALEPNIVKQEAFLNTPKLETLDLGSLLVIIEGDAFKGSGVKELTVRATYPAAMTEGVFTEEMSSITVKVPNELVDTYKAAAGWSYLNIVGDANLAAGGENLGMPDGLYYASSDGLLKCAYADGQFDEYNVGDVPHTFQLLQFKNRIYGSSAGQKFVYSGSAGVEGDGKLFYISQINNNTFQAVVLDNAGNNAYKDPFNLYIYGDILYVNDRNVCIRKIPADAIALSQDYPSWVENNWLGYYSANWAYGCIKCGFAITEDQDAESNPEPLYWVGMKYNGYGIFRFKEGDINSGSKPTYSPILESLQPIFTTFNIDSKNGYLYIYIEKAGRPADSTVGSVSGPEEDGTLIKGGLYRAKMSDVLATPDPTYAQFKEIYTLVDGAPVRYEGSATNEHVGISQLTIDENGEYMYWCYRAASADDVEKASDPANQTNGRYVWAEAYDETNPLHQSGIKRIRLADENPVPEIVVPGVEGYGVVPVNYEGSEKPDAGVENIVSEKVAVDRVIVSGSSYTLTENAQVNIYSMTGAVVASGMVAADNNNSLDGYATGVYVIEARFADGAKQVVKVAVK